MSYNIFHIVDNLGVGGAQTCMFEIFHAISRYYPQHKQKIIYKQHSRYNDSFVKSAGIAPKNVKEDRRIPASLGDNKHTVVIYHKLASSSPSTVEIIRRKTKAKIIVINHTLFRTSSWNQYNKLDIMVSVSKHMKRKMESWCPKMKHTCIRNGFNQYRCQNIQARAIDKKAFFLTGRINRICAWKHSDKWLEWCSTVKLPKPMVHEYMGDRISGRFKHNPKHKGRNTIKMLGGIDDFRKKISIIKSWDIFLYGTNHNEGISMAILEALACGVPVICSDHYGNKEIIQNGVNGYVYKDKKHAKDILTRLIKYPSELKDLKRSTVKHFQDHLDAKHTVKKYIELMDGLFGVKSSELKEVIEIKSDPEKVNLEIVPSINKKFTILSASYNKAEYLKDWASSICKQTYRPMEVVLVDDKSSDNTMQIIKSIKNDFCKSDIEFKFISNEQRLYCGSSYHCAVSHATGSFIGVVDADDMLIGDAVKNIMKIYDKHPDIAWIYTQFLWCNEKMQKKRRGFNRVPPKGQSLLDLGKRGIHGIGAGWRTFNYKIKRPDKLFGQELTCAVDKHMAYRMEEMGLGMFVDETYYQHRGHPIGSMKSVSSTKTAMEMWKIVIKRAYKRRKRYNKKVYPIIGSK